ncbi:SRPBCC domain-containing protein [Lacihabitans sp. LS3-19]|uniref:SRPBCC family protein n=1 Tax=Lacihabitans sp. LS3-19 TaxID=2487335 RepID=UPI0020CDFAA2|nr:SRPBCC domain-containing protein [Lacihabitans sp. LS3-19]MCP9768946.1 SRPBCC domain-containing protein [Lacihabitans sp. LS3-19]
MQKDIIHHWHFNHSPEKVWRLLTETELLAKWLMINDFKPEIGHKFTFYAKPIIKMGFDGRIYCEVLEVEPFKKLSYTWKGGPKPGKITLDSVVTWTLKSNDQGTLLTLEHTGFKGIKNYLTYIFMNKGWEKIAKRLGKELEL